MLTVGTLAAGASLIFLAGIQNLAMFYLGMLIGRTLVATIPTLGGSVAVVNWFIQRRKAAMAVLMLASYLGIAVLPITFVVVLGSSNWRTALWVIGSITMVSAIVPWIFIVAKQPEEVGLVPDGLWKTDQNHNYDLQSTIEENWTTRCAIRTQSFWFLTASTMTVMLLMGSQLHRIPFFLQRGLDPTAAGLWAMGLAVGMSSGGFIVAVLGKWIPDRKLLAGAALLGALLMLLISITPVNAMFVVLHASGDGLVVGSTMTLMPTMYGNYFGRRSGGAIRGIAHVPMMAANAAGPMVPSLSYDFAASNYLPGFHFIGLCLLAGAILAYMSKKPIAVEFQGKRENIALEP